MKWTLNLILFVLCLWLYVSNNPVAGDIDEKCKVNCSCCKDKLCGQGQWFSDQCTSGCIDGYIGARCYLKCPQNCKTCVSEQNTPMYCTTCYDGYYDPAHNCTSACLSNCKTCTSGSSCTSCKEDYYNENQSENCPHRYCPENCNCANNKCSSCKDGFYDISNSCNSLCPGNCFTCSSTTNCDSCKKGYFNGKSSSIQLNDCTNVCPNNCDQCSSYEDCSACKIGFYGQMCENSCSAGCNNRICDKRTGNCYCSPNFTGEKCDKCQNGTYGDMCDQDCSSSCKGKLCDKKSGDCKYGCRVDKIVGNKCDICKTGWYGSYCNLSCSVGCLNKQCKKTNGECSDGCLINFKGKKCDQCENGKYGYHCNNDCQNNCDEEGCLKESGNCIKCILNFDGEKCDRCIVGLYGTACSEECPTNCLRSACERSSGNCSHGCDENYSGNRCCVNNKNCIYCSSDSNCKECKSGYFSDQCDKRCPENCLDSCNIDTGICDDCKNNFYGERCNFTCASSCKNGTKANDSRCLRKDGECQYDCFDGFHGPQCSAKCSSYCIDKKCNKGNGKCTEGCIKKVTDDPICPLELRQKEDVDDVGGQSLIGGIVGGVVSVLVAVAVVVTAVIMYRRRQSGRNKGERPDLENTQLSRTSGNAEHGHTYGNISAVEDSGPKTKAKNERQSASIPAAIDASHLGNDIRQRSVVSASLDVNDVEINEDRDDDQNDDPYYNITDSPYRIKVTNLLKYVTSKTIDFEAEFKKLNKDLDLTKHCSVAKQPENIALNRYNGIYPYDHSRVTIPDIPDFFINACYIDGYCKEKEYIASLGPTSKTTANFSSFWLMVWYKKTDIIVMLTNLRETSGMKCEQYWPEAETENVYGEITVKCRSSEEFAEYSVRTYTILKGKERRQVIQLHYTAWPDKGVPQEVTSLVEFRQRVNVVPKTLGGPIIVHCSAGVGRTGTYIGLDTLTKEGKEKGFVDIFECVNKMRYQRVNMVQTAEQYKFLHKALVHSLSFGCEIMTAEEIQKIMYEADANTFSNIYKSLAQEVDTETKDELTAREENKKRHKDKNRRHSGTPGNNSRVRLFLARKEGQHDYINAVFINSFRIKNLFIASQTPLPGTIEDFISMIFQQNTACVVALEDQNNPSKDIGHYLPADNETYTFGHFSVTSSKNETKSQYVLKNLTVKDYAKDQKKSVYHFQYKNWQTSKKVPDNATEFVQFVKEVEKYVSKDLEDQPNIIAHCLNGFERTGLFCIVYKLLEKLEAERQVSVVNTIRKIRTHRRQSITSVEQLKFCFECISAYLETYSTYTNFAS